MKKLLKMFVFAMMLPVSLAFAADLPKTELAVVGGFSNLNATMSVQKRFLETQAVKLRSNSPPLIRWV